MYDINDEQSGLSIGILVSIFSVGLMAAFSFAYLFYSLTRIPDNYDADFELSNDDNFIDLLIDEDNPTNYIIDYNINRKSGNLPTDYYKGNMEDGEKDEI